MNDKEKIVWELLEQVKDPEIPVLSVVDLGVIRRVEFNGDKVEVDITPTYTGCPAMDTIERDVRRTLQSNGYTPEIQTVISPAWTTDWITQKGRKALEEFGIAPPQEGKSKGELLGDNVRCPRCGSTNTKLISAFGSTACKAHYNCLDCLEPFDHFKCH